MRVQSKTKKSTTGSRNPTRSVGGYGGDTYHDDGSDDEGAISLAAIKNKYKKGMNAPVKGKLYIIKMNKVFYLNNSLVYMCIYIFSIKYIFIR